MKKLLLFVFVFFISLTSVTQAEIISDFEAEYLIKENGKVRVVETITYDFEENSRHGIFRILENKHPQPATAWYKNRSVDINVLSVTRDGLSEPYLVTDSRDEREIKIGDADKTITGLHQYEIVYELTGALSYGSEGAEFYWSVTGNDWPVAIEKAAVTVRGEKPDILIGSNACYQGYAGDSKKCDSFKKVGNAVVFEANQLNSGQGLTVATELNPGAVSYLVVEDLSYVLLGVIFVVSWILFFGYRIYRFRTKMKVDLPVVAQYEPYENYLPMYTGLLFDGRLDPRDITAGILYLAEQGFIKIKKTEDKIFLFIKTTDYEITLLRPVAEIPTEFLRQVLSLLFKSYDTPPKTIRLSELTKNRVSNALTIKSLKSSLKKDLEKNGFTVNTWPSFGWWLIFTPVVLFVVAWMFGWGEFITILLFLVVPTVIMVVLLVIDRRTKKGYEVLNHLKGFKLFLSITDKERFTFHNAPEKSPELFMKYLPYAVALGVEKEWAKVFSDITIPEPDWYEGGRVGAFSATELTNDIGAFSSSFATSSGTSGSSGGGSVGGGGGGGGGGSW